MKIDQEKCIGCEECRPYCPVGAIIMQSDDTDPKSTVNTDACVECGVCLRSGVCPVDAIYQPKLGWPRYLRAAFSDPCAAHRGSREMGRGTEEMKTNEVTGLFGPGVAGLAIEMGRPGCGTSLRDVEKMTRAVAQAGVVFALQNPVTSLITDTFTGSMEPDILGERVLSAIIEFSVELDRLADVLTKIKTAAENIDTVFSLDLINRVDPDGGIPAIPIAVSAGFMVGIQNKTNLGLGRPLKEEITK